MNWTPAASVDDAYAAWAPHPTAPRQRGGWLPHGFAEWFAVGQTFLPALLFLPASQPYRLFIRTGAYAASLFAFAIWWFDRAGRRRAVHPAQRWLAVTMFWLCLEALHPDSNLMVSVAQISLYFAIFCPVFWASSYVFDRRQLMRTLAVLVVCNGINAMVGVMQVYDPDRWMPRQFAGIYSAEGGDMLLSAMTYIGPGGRLIIRPPGLFDSPGAVAGAGTVATILGLMFFIEPLAWWKRAASLAFAVAGISAIYLSHVRAAFAATLLMMVAYMALLATQRQKARVVGFASVAAAILLIGFTLSVALGGQSVAERFTSLFQEDPTSVYYQSRGVQVRYAVTDMAAEYPVGAGLGRWGMLSYYFGDRRSGLFAEVQTAAWVLDGGMPLVFLYSLTLLATLLADWKLIRSLADPEDKRCATIVVATNIGTVGLIATFIPFGTAVGMQFWFLEGLLRGAMADRPRIG